MKLKRFNDKLNENREMYFVGDRKATEEEQKFEIIEKLSQNWSEKLKQDYLVPRSLYNYSLKELKEIENFYLGESFHQPDGTPIPVDSKHRPIMAKKERDEDFIASKLDYLGWVDIMNTERVEEFEKSEYFNDDMNDEEYANAMSTWLYDISDGTINESVRIVEPKNNDLENALAELKEQHGSNEAVEDIRLEGNEIVFDVKCETDIQGTTEYNGFNLRYNKLCEIPQSNEQEYDEIDEDQIFEQINHWKIRE